MSITIPGTFHLRGEVRYKNEITGPCLQLRNSIDSLGVSRFWRTNDSAGGRKKKEEGESEREKRGGGRSGKEQREERRDGRKRDILFVSDARVGSRQET